MDHHNQLMGRKLLSYDHSYVGVMTVLVMCLETILVCQSQLGFCRSSLCL